jgi:hypothetical protein
MLVVKYFRLSLRSIGGHVPLYRYVKFSNNNKSKITTCSGIHNKDDCNIDNALLIKNLIQNLLSVS